MGRDAMWLCAFAASREPKRRSCSMSQEVMRGENSSHWHCSPWQWNSRHPDRFTLCGSSDGMFGDARVRLHMSNSNLRWRS